MRCQMSRNGDAAVMNVPNALVDEKLNAIDAKGMAAQQDAPSRSQKVLTHGTRIWILRPAFTYSSPHKNKIN